MYQVGEYRGFIAGVLAVLCLYALLSCWPALRALVLNRSGSPPAPAAQSSQSAVPSGGPAGGAPTAAASRPIYVQSLYLSTEPAPEDSRGDSAWKVTRADLVLLEKPGGVGLRPPSLCRAALVVCRGAHVRVLGERDGWVKVQSPSRAVGWVSAEAMRAGD